MLTSLQIPQLGGSNLDIKLFLCNAFKLVLSSWLRFFEQELTTNNGLGNKIEENGY